MRVLRQGLRVFGGVFGLALAAVVAGLLNDEVGFWAAIAWLVLAGGAIAANFVLRLWGR